MERSRRDLDESERPEGMTELAPVHVGCSNVGNLCRSLAVVLSLNRYIFSEVAKVLIKYYYTPGIYADGYIVFAFPVRSWNLRQSFALKFLKRCISQQLRIRNDSYLDHSYPGGLAFTP